MKKTKFILSTLVSLLLSFVLVFAVACDNGGDDVEVPEEIPNVQPAPEVPDKPAGDLGITDSSPEALALQFLEIVQVGKTEFNVGEEYTSADLNVRAVLLNPDKQQTAEDPQSNLERRPLTAEDYTIDSSDYNPDRVGTYTIYLSYTYGGITATAYYSVTVRAVEPAIGGIVAELADGKEDTYALTADATSVTIPKDILAVYSLEADDSGKAVKSAAPLDAEEYTAQLYLGSKLIENNEATENGTYSLVATLEKDPTKQDFIPVYVVNPVTGIELVANASGAVYEQAPGMVDHMSATWQFKLTYANGLTKTIKAGEAGLTIELDTRTAGENKTATVKYVEAGIEVTCTVTYTIKAGGTTQPVGDPLVINITDLFNAGTLAVQDYAEDVLLGADDNISVSVLANDGNKVSVDANNKSMDGYSFTHRLKLSGKGTNLARSIKIEVSGAVIVTVYMMSSSSSDSREVGIWTGSFDPSPSEGAATEPVVATQTVGGSSLEKHEYQLDEAGTYYLAAVSGGTNVYGIVISPVGGGSVEPELPAGDPLVINVTDLFNAGTLAVQDYAENVVLGADDHSLITVLANDGNKVSVDANNKSMDGYSFTHRLKLSGKGTDAARSIKIEVSGAVIVTVYMMSSSSGDSREVGIWTGTFDPATDAATVATQTVGGSSLEKHEYQLDEAGTYYLAAVSGGTNVYGIVITPLG